MYNIQCLRRFKRQRVLCDMCSFLASVSQVRKFVHPARAYLEVMLPVDQRITKVCNFRTCTEICMHQRIIDPI